MRNPAELHPRVFGVNVKQLTNCRLGLIAWSFIPICGAVYQYNMLGYVSAGMFVNVALQNIYLFKFYYWETGYFNTMDMQHDRAGSKPSHT